MQRAARARPHLPPASRRQAPPRSVHANRRDHHRQAVEGEAALERHTSSCAATGRCSPPSGRRAVRRTVALRGYCSWTWMQSCSSSSTMSVPRASRLSAGISFPREIDVLPQLVLRAPAQGLDFLGPLEPARVDRPHRDEDHLLELAGKTRKKVQERVDPEPSERGHGQDGRARVLLERRLVRLGRRGGTVVRAWSSRWRLWLVRT